MSQKRILFVLVCLGLPLLTAAQAGAQETWTVDILGNPARYWNTTVTVVGQVQTVTPNPAGTTRGTYTLLDESSPNPLTIRTNDLPPISRNFKVTGVIIQDPAQANVPIMKELARSAPGMATTTLYLLIAAGVVFVVLLIVFIVLLTKPKKPVMTAETIRPTSRPTGGAPATAWAPVDSSKTMKLAPASPSVPPMPAPTKTQVFLSLGADIVVDKGPDKDKSFPLHLQATTIGRPGNRKNDIELNDDTVSKEQASIYYDSARKTFSIANESATNPTRLNGQPVSGPTIIEDGASIDMGRTVLRLKKS